MQLKYIKLSGFKSFADNTVIPIRSNLSAIVGPNGCGKSNVVDAIRWVVGESSAKQLRGQSMSDVIFNGTTSRKPVGKASIELVFDNSDGRLGGEYAAFSEVSIKREVVREGGSNYFINGVMVRRRDIITIFLGTGLGPRSYAIIEQGMISRLVEAKPDDMRGYLEEVAGISKYKDRRKDTESRMRRTQENLDRVRDITEELATQCRRLKRQANAAERYKVLKEEESTLSGQIKALNWKKLNQQRQQIQQQHEVSKVRYEELVAQQRQFETVIEKNRQQEITARDQEAEVQRIYYDQASNIARIEQQIQHAQSQLSTWQSELEEAIELKQDLTESSFDQRQQIQQLNEELQGLSPRAQEIHEAASQMGANLEAAKERMTAIQASWEQHQNQYAQTKRQYEVTLNSQSHLTQQCNDLDARYQRLSSSRSSEQLETLLTELEPMNLAVTAAAQEVDMTQQALSDLLSQIAQQRDQNQQNKQTLKEAQQKQQQQQSELTALQALQQAALNDEMTEAWLEKENLQSAPRLGQCLSVEKGWEFAVETVLGDHFNALCVDDTETLFEKLNGLSQGRLTFLKPIPAALGSMKSQWTALASLVESQWPLEQWLAGVYVAETVEAAMQMQPQLEAAESVVTKEGVWIGHNWLRVAKSAGNEDSVLVREQNITELELACAETGRLVMDAETLLLQGEERLLTLESEREEQHARYQQLSRSLVDLKAEHSAVQSKYNQLKHQQQQVLAEIDELSERQQQVKEKLNDVERELQRLSSDVESLEAFQPELQQQREDAQSELALVRDQAQAAKQRRDELDIRVTSNENQLSLLQQSIDRSDRQLQQVEDKRVRLEDNLSEGGGPLERLNAELQSKLAEHVEVEQRHQSAEQALKKVVATMTDTQRQLNQIIKQVSSAKDQLQEFEVKLQGVGVRQETIIEQIQQADQNLEAMINSLPEEANLSGWNEQLEQVAKRISRLGPINLAAIEEYETLSERKNYLDTQKADLEEALSVLDDAIKKIDRETRHKFKDTFIQVKQGFSELFPKIFGGGRAVLELEENDYLTSGVLIKAQPPGKRNSTIHMLSGGEKALTAIALVFAMFRLNPAPFCILDEVDAPLDDVNVGRFCNLVKEMAKSTQFLVISHNKVTISMADHLMGVTMHEAGVSRIVSVDVEQAIEMVDA